MTGTRSEAAGTKDRGEDRVLNACMPVSGQTYSRKVDSFVLQCPVSGIAQSCEQDGRRFMRLLAHMKEFDEPFESVARSAPPPWHTSETRCVQRANRYRWPATSSTVPANAADTAAGSVARADAGRLREPQNYDTGMFSCDGRNPVPCN